MKPKYLEPEWRGRDRWMVSYLDVLTILLVFFISVAVRTQAAISVPSPAPKAEKPTPAPTPLADARKRLSQAGLDVRVEKRGVVISLPQAVLFDSGEDRISKSALPVVKTIASAICDLPNRIMFVGYTDAVPIHNRRFRNNWELSAKRGLRLLELMSREYGISEARLSVSSDGANRPAASNETAEGRAGNRRVEIVIVSE